MKYYYCRHCKITVESEDIFCGNCGTKIILENDFTYLKYFLQEAVFFYQSAIEPLRIIPGLQDELKKYIIFDLFKIASICGYADKPINSKEYVALLFMTSVVLNGGNKLINIISDFEKLKKLEEQIVSDPKIIDLKDQVAKTIKTSNSATLQTMIYLKELDLKTGNNLSEKMANSLYRVASVIVKADGTVTAQEKASLEYLAKLIYSTNKSPNSSLLSKTCKGFSCKGTKGLNKMVSVTKNLEETIKELNGLVGMENIKKEVSTLMNFIKAEKTRLERGLSNHSLSLHAVFFGPPGTGKTTVARILGSIYRNLGVLTKGHLVETDRSGCVAGYVGQTALKMDEVVNSALDGVLFIDEAYSLSNNDNKDFGHEAIDVLLKRMEDYRDRLVVVVAGYPDEMQKFIQSNPGLKSRFTKYFNFDHYNPDELFEMFNKFCSDSNFKVSTNAQEKTKILLKNNWEKRDKFFGNGRLVRNIFEKTLEHQANRIASIVPLTDEVLTTIEEDDVIDDKHLSLLSDT